MAQRFDSATGRLIGEPSTVVEPISRGAGDNPDAAFWAGPMGMLAFRGAAAENRRLTGSLVARAHAWNSCLARTRDSSFFLSPARKEVACGQCDEHEFRSRHLDEPVRPEHHDQADLRFRRE